MSYKGYVQMPCDNGHYWDEHERYDDLEAGECSVCGSRAVWQNMVDETNCDSYGKIDMAPFLVKAAEKQTCNLGHIHQVGDERYRIPTHEESLKARNWRPGYGGTPLVPLDP